MTAVESMPHRPPRRAAYLHAAILFAPAVVFWLGARMVVWPRLEWLWANTGFASYSGLEGGAAPIACDPHQIISVIRAAMRYTPYGAIALFGLVLIADFFFRISPRGRNIALTAFVVTMLTFVFTVLTTMCFSAIMACPPAR